MADIALLGEVIAEVVAAHGRSDARTLQSVAGIIGFSDLGFCRQKAVLMTKGVPQSDSKPLLAAQFGTAWHAYLRDALREAFPEWTIESRRVTATFACGAEVSGTPDVVTTPDWNAIVDHKTSDGLQWYITHGVSQNQRWQRHGYAMGAVAAGLLDESKPIYVGNLFWDRGGKQPPLFLYEEFDPTLTPEINSWIEDVIYAVQNNEDGSRDIPAETCDKICEYFTVCRGNLPVNEGNVPIEDESQLLAIDTYVMARDDESAAKELKLEARERLLGVNGIGNGWQVRWTDKMNSTTGLVTPSLSVTKVRSRGQQTQ